VRRSYLPGPPLYSSSERGKLAIDSRIVPGGFPNPVAELACVTRPRIALQEA